MKKFPHNQKNILIAFFAVLTVVGFGWGFYEANRTDTATNYIENDASRSYYELMDSVDQLSVLSGKAIVVTDSDNRAALYSEMSSAAYVAQENLSMLPVYNVTLSRTVQFLNQIGDFSAALVAKAARGEELTSTESETLKELNVNVTKIAKSLHELETTNATYLSYKSIQSANQKINKGDLKNAGDAVTSLSSINEEISSTPSLIYDGPYSDTLQNKEPVKLSGDKINWSAAKAKAKQVLGDSYSYEAYGRSSKSSTIAVYTVAVKHSAKDNDAFAYIDISQTGGYVVQYTANNENGKEAISKETALSNSAAFLEKTGYSQLKAGYYLIDNNIMTVNYMYDLNGVVVYPDMIKVSVDMATGEIVGFDAKNYLEYHKDRTLPTLILTKEAAASHLPAGVTPEASGKAVIPKPNGDEAYCYEFHFRENDTDYIIYINAVTGKEEDVLIVKDNESGTFTM